MFDFDILQEGFAREVGSDDFHSTCTVTLLRGVDDEGNHLNALVDTGSPWDKDNIVAQLESKGLRPSDISHVICTHGHLDHVGNLNLFPASQMIVGGDFCRGDNRYDTRYDPLASDWQINKWLSVISTPGHTNEDVSVVAHLKSGQKLVCAGDIFENEGDSDCWKQYSFDPEKQLASRTRILGIADIIVPGHGPQFQVKKKK